MSYTIASLEEPHTGLTLDIGKSGNAYIVGLYRKDSGVYTHRLFTTLDEAYKVFEKLSSWIIYGFYSEDDRRYYLQYGTMK